MKAVGTFALLGAMGVLAACIDPSAPPPKAYCVALCERLDECWEIADQTLCVRRCLDDGWAESASSATLEELGDCIKGRACRDLLDGTGFAHCWEQVGSGAVPPEQCRILCEAHAVKFAECRPAFFTETPSGGAGGSTGASEAEQSPPQFLRGTCLALPCDLTDATAGLVPLVECSSESDCVQYLSCAEEGLQTN